MPHPRHEPQKGGLSYVWAGYPGLFACLLDEDPKLRLETWAECVRDYQAWDDCKDVGSLPLRDYYRKSSFNWTDVAEFFAESSFNGFAITPSMMTQIDRIFMYMPTTLPTECSFQNLEDQSRGGKNKRMSPLTLWRVPSRRRGCENSVNCLSWEEAATAVGATPCATAAIKADSLC